MDQVHDTACAREKKAVTLDANQIKKTISGSKVQKRKNVVQVLDSPFVYDWSHLSPEQEQQILSSLLKAVCPVRAESKGKSKTLYDEGSDVHYMKSKTKEATILARRHYAIGLRDVTKAVTSSETLVVFCEKSTDPAILTKLLIPICHVKGIPLIPIKQFSSTISKSLKVLRCLTLALKKPIGDAGSPFHKSYMEIKELLNLIAAKSPTHYPAEVLLPSCETSVSDIASLDLKKKKLTEASRGEPHNEEKYYLKKASSGFRFIPNVTRNPLLASNDARSNAATFGADFIALKPPKDEPIVSNRNVTILRRPKLKKIERDETKTKRKNNVKS